MSLSSMPRNTGRDRPAPRSLVQVDLGGRSDPGKVRPNNEDYYLILRFGRFLETMQTNLPADTVPSRAEEGGHAMVVADGMGGCAAGEEASRRALAILVNLVLSTPDWILRLDEPPLPKEVLRRAVERYEQINKNLEEDAKADPGLSGFGTTLTMAWGLGSDLFLAHLGDSRAYLLRKGRLQQLTSDHTLAQAVVDQGLMDWQQATTLRLRHVLTQSLGDHGRQILPDVTWVALEDNDHLLLCTDGLTEMVDNETIAKLLGSGEPAETICQRLVDRALEAGGKDNVTVVVARYRLP